MNKELVNLIKIPKISDPRGNLAILEKNILPFSFKRIYYLFDVPTGAFRGGHSHKMQQEFLIALSGSFEVFLDNSHQKETITLNNPALGLLIGVGVWREIKNFSSGAICLVVSSGEFEEEDYIRDYDEFMKSKC